MIVTIYPHTEDASEAAAEALATWLASPETRTLMLASGNSPENLYQRIADRKLNLGHLHTFALDEYVGVPPEEPRNCANSIRRTAIVPWGVSESRFYRVSPVEDEALDSIRGHEAKLHELGGLDVIVLGLGQNGHLGFNEPGSAEDSVGRIVELEPISIEANRQWFGGDYAPAKGVTVGLSTILSARHIVILAFGPHKAAAVLEMIEGPRSSGCPASFLQGHASVHVFLDRFAAAELAGQSEDAPPSP